MRVWLKADALLHTEDGDSCIRIPAGTCLFMMEDQGWVPQHCIAVWGAGIRDMVPIEWLTLDPQEAYAD